MASTAASALRMGSGIGSTRFPAVRVPGVWRESVVRRADSLSVGGRTSDPVFVTGKPDARRRPTSLAASATAEEAEGKSLQQKILFGVWTSIAGGLGKHRAGGPNKMPVRAAVLLAALASASFMHQHTPTPKPLLVSYVFRGDLETSVCQYGLPDIIGLGELFCWGLVDYYTLVQASHPRVPIARWTSHR